MLILRSGFVDRSTTTDADIVERSRTNWRRVALARERVWLAAIVAFLAACDVRALRLAVLAGRSGIARIRSRLDFGIRRVLHNFAVKSSAWFVRHEFF